jgi:hypothetical protein
VTTAPDNIVAAPAPIPQHELREVLSGSVPALRARSTGQEIVRAGLALIALGLVCGTVYLAFSASQHGDWASAKEWLDVVLPAEVGTVGSALGFYFGSHRSPGG